jgi:hypothetical protein
MSEYVRRIDQSIEDLRQLLDVLADELDECAFGNGNANSNAVPLDATLCRDSIQALNELLPKLDAARAMMTQPSNSLSLEELAPRLSLSTEY